MQNHSNELVVDSLANENYEFAGFWVRLAAYAIDMAVVTVGLLIVRLVFMGINSLIAGTFLEGGILFHYTLKDIVLYLFQVVYFILFTFHTGTTLGKKAMNLRVICKDSEEKPSLLTVVYRETIGRFLSGLILCIGYLIIGIDKEKRGLHDILCDTRVIYAKRVKVYPVYQGNVLNSKSGENRETNQIVSEHEETDYVPRIVEEPSTEGDHNSMQEDIQAQWNRILNPQKEETIPQTEEQNIEGES